MSELEINHQQFDSQFAFLTTCLGRVKNLYALFEEEIKGDKFDYTLKFEDASGKINTFYEECLNSIFDSQYNFKSDVNSFYKLAPSYEEYTTFYASVATQIALMCTSIGEFYQSRNVDLIGEVLMNVDEVINIMKSIEYNRQNLGDDPWDYVSEFLEIEHANRTDILEEIVDHSLSKEQFLELVSKYVIRG
ncbi:hypothetical protein [Pedobacter terrae]|uniref:hypothetical protein n=1 Tax=Pedobacter terrae TaxID=405671 RepID=UPI002FF87EFE